MIWKRDSGPSPAESSPASPPAAAPAPATPPQPRASAGASSVTLIGETVRIHGEMTSQEDIQVDGQLEGKLDSRNLLRVGGKGKITAGVKAREVDIAGTVEGNIDASERIVLRKGANLVGDVRTTGIVIEDGAYFKGGIDIARSGHA